MLRTLLLSCILTLPSLCAAQYYYGPGEHTVEPITEICSGGKIQGVGYGTPLYAGGKLVKGPLYGERTHLIGDGGTFFTLSGSHWTAEDFTCSGFDTFCHIKYRPGMGSGKTDFNKLFLEKMNRGFVLGVVNSFHGDTCDFNKITARDIGTVAQYNTGQAICHTWNSLFVTGRKTKTVHEVIGGGNISQHNTSVMHPCVVWRFRDWWKVRGEAEAEAVELEIEALAEGKTVEEAADIADAYRKTHKPKVPAIGHGNATYLDTMTKIDTNAFYQDGFRLLVKGDRCPIQMKFVGTHFSVPWKRPSGEKTPYAPLVETIGRCHLTFDSVGEIAIRENMFKCTGDSAVILITGSMCFPDDVATLFDLSSEGTHYIDSVANRNHSDYRPWGCWAVTIADGERTAVKQWPVVTTKIDFQPPTVTLSPTYIEQEPIHVVPKPIHIERDPLEVPAGRINVDQPTPSVTVEIE